MLRLRSQAIRSLGASYTCPSCLAAAGLRGASGLQSRFIANRRTRGDGARTLAISASRAADHKDPKERPKKPSPKNAPKNAPKSGSQSKNKQSSKPAKSKQKKATLEHSAEETRQQLSVLQGALTALKNVLDQQNIRFDTKRAEKQQASKSSDTTALGLTAPHETVTHLEDSTAVAKTKKEKPKLEQSPADDQMKQERARLRADLKAATKLSRKSNQQNTMKSDVVVKKVSVRPKIQSSDNAIRKVLPEDLSTVKKSPAETHRAASGSRLAKLRKHSHSALHLGKYEHRPSPDDDVLEVDFNNKSPLVISRISPEELHLAPIEKPQPPVPAVAHGLERVLFNPGVYRLQDPRSKVYNFDPYLANIMPIEDFDFDALKQYVTSSKDTTLIDVAREHGKKYTGSTSSMTSMLSHFHYLLSAWREINPQMMSQDFEIPSHQFTRLLRAPAAVFLHYKDGVYAIDADKEFDSASILSMLGKSMEKLLTLPVEEYEKYRRGNSHQIPEEERNAAEAYHYTGLLDFMMRSQLDAHDPRMPGTGMFDIKTRAVISIRMDSKDFQKGLGYELRHRFGNWESFEREYYDMIRAAFLKYSLQVRMGRMDGIFVAYHNTQRIFGFQYVPLEEMDLSLHGTSDLRLGDEEFKLSLALLNELLNRATEKFPKKSLRLFVETRISKKTPFMYAFVKPVDAGEIEAVQSAGKASVEEFERNILGLKPSLESTSPLEEEDGREEASDRGKESDAQKPQNEPEVQAEAEENEQSTVSWNEIQAILEDAIEDDELGIGAVRQAIEDALEESGLLAGQSTEEARGYVDALLSAVTGGSAEPPTSMAESIDVDIDPGQSLTPPSESTDSETTAAESETAENGTDQSSLADSSTDAATRNGNRPVEISSASESVTKESPDARQKEEEEVEEEEEEEEEDTEVQESQDDVASSPDMTELSKFILRMTRRLDESGISKQQEEDSVSTKLREFEHILDKIISESRDDEDETNDAIITKEPSETGDHSKSAAEAASTSSGADANVETTSIAAGASEAEAPDATTRPGGSGPILGMVLTVRNKVNGKFVTRPEHLTKNDTWEVEYNIEELPEERAHRLLVMCGKRRQKDFMQGSKNRTAWSSMFDGALPKYSHEGRQYRQREEKVAKQRPVYILGNPEAKTYEDVFGSKK